MTLSDSTSTRWSMWFAFFAGPTAWAMHELLTYALVKIACGNGLMIVEYLVTLVCIGLAGAGAYISHRSTRVRVPHTSAEFMYVAALVLNGLFAYAIVMETLPDLIVSPCL